MISDDEIGKMLAEYNSWFNKYGDSHLSVGWNKPKAVIRFKIFLDEFRAILNDKECIVLDLGCGLAHFYQYLLNEKISCQYVGVDINPRFIKYCKELYPLQTFVCETVENLEISADLIFASGLFNRKFINSPEFIKKVYLYAEKASKVGFALNFLDINAITKYEKNYYSSACEVTRLFSRDKLYGYKIDASTLSGEFTFFAYK
jgi:SAM-dependent methyltransferase